MYTDENFYREERGGEAKRRRIPDGDVRTEMKWDARSEKKLGGEKKNHETP